MEYGFYHPKLGYWQTTNEPQQHIVDEYPSGTTKIPIKPAAGYEWSGSEWIYVALPPPTQIQQEIKRQAAYVKEADPLFFKWKAGESTESEWLAKREEIRTRFSYSEGV